MHQLRFTCGQCGSSSELLHELNAEVRFSCPICQASSLVVQKIRGYVYILSNELMPGVVKIGFTERSIDERVAELSAHTGVAMPYKEEAGFPVADPVAIERLVHEKLSKYRISQNREFFKLTPFEAINAVREVLGLKPLPPPVTEESVKQSGQHATYALISAAKRGKLTRKN